MVLPKKIVIIESICQWQETLSSSTKDTIFNLALCLNINNLSTCNDYNLDIDECNWNTCDLNATCTNTIGSYMCDCFSGFSGDGKDCYGKLIQKYRY